MGVLGLHNECPPNDYAAAEVGDVIRGLSMDEVATAASLRVVRDCLECLACMDDTVRSVVDLWAESAAAGPEAMEVFARGQEGIFSTFQHAFAAVSDTPGLITESLLNYKELEAYAVQARNAGRGIQYEASLVRLGEDSFQAMVRTRVELLRKVGVRIELFQNQRELGMKTLEEFDFPTFFNTFMQPLRDLAEASRDLYSEMVRGALVSHRAMLQSCALPIGEGRAATTYSGEGQALAGAVNG